MKYFLSFVASFFFLGGYAQEGFSLAGTWLGTNQEGSTTVLLFDVNGAALIFINGEVLEGAGGNMTYNIDYTTNPAKLDLTIKREGQTIKIYGIISIIEKNKVRIVWGSERPVEFPEASTAIYYRQNHNFKIRKQE